MNIEELEKVVKKSIDSFRNNEIAFLSLTSKNEFVIRDRIAYEIFKEYEECRVTREYKPKKEDLINGKLIKSRIDLVVFKEEKLTDIIELKSLYTFDSKNPWFIKAIDYDFEKNRNLVSNKVKQYEIVIATHVKNISDNSFEKYIKYYGGIKNSFKSLKYNNELRDKLNNILEKKYTKDKYTIKSFCKDAGMAFDMDVAICIWIIEANFSYK